MTIILFATCFWLFALSGWGVLLLNCADIENKCGATLEQSIFMGLPVIVLLAIALHLAIPVDGAVSFITGVVGWLLALYFIFRSRLSVSFSEIAAILLLAVLVSWVACKPVLHYDTGLYHLQSVKWITELNATLGLANLQDRYGFNTVLHPLAAIVELPALHDKAAYFVNALFMVPFGMLVYRSATYIWHGGSDVGTWYGVACGIPLSMLLFSRWDFPGLSSDIPAMLSVLSAIYYFLQMYEKKMYDLSFVSCMALSMFAFGLKLSAAFIGFIALFALYAAINRDGVLIVKKQRVFLGFCIVFVVLYLIRGTMLSGYPLFPIGWKAAIGAWVVDREIMAGAVEGISSYARNPFGPAPSSSLDKEWFLEWGIRVLKNPVNKAWVSIMVFGLVLCVSQASAIYKLTIRRKELFWVELMLVVGVTHWFLSAPDPRFAYGYLFGLGILWVSIGVMAFLDNRGIASARWILGSILFGAVFVPAVKYRHLDTHFYPSDIRLSWWKLPELPVVESQEWTTASGWVIRTHGNDGAACWAMDRPATDHARKNRLQLRYIERSFLPVIQIEKSGSSSNSAGLGFVSSLDFTGKGK